ncbi:MAG: hypothetical protein ACJ76Y_01510 [Thermoanaerobaculia bacterium]
MAFKVADLAFKINILSEDEVELGFGGCGGADASVMVDLLTCGPTNNPEGARGAAVQFNCGVGTLENLDALMDSLRVTLLHMETTARRIREESRSSRRDELRSLRRN